MIKWNALNLVNTSSKTLRIDNAERVFFSDLFLELGPFCVHAIIDIEKTYILQDRGKSSTSCVLRYQLHQLFQIEAHIGSAATRTHIFEIGGSDLMSSILILQTHPALLGI